MRERNQEILDNYATIVEEVNNAKKSKLINVTSPEDLVQTIVLFFLENPTVNIGVSSIRQLIFLVLTAESASLCDTVPLSQCTGEAYEMKLV